MASGKRVACAFQGSGSRTRVERHFDRGEKEFFHSMKRLCEASIATGTPMMFGPADLAADLCSGSCGGIWIY
jgi:hypothetical protein